MKLGAGELLNSKVITELYVIGHMHGKCIFDNSCPPGVGNDQGNFSWIPGREIFFAALSFILLV